MTVFKIFLILVVTIGLTSALLPSFISPCYRDDPNLRACLLKESQNVIKPFTAGIPEINLPPIDPLDVGEIVIEAPNGNGLSQRHWNCQMIGLSNMKITDIEINIENKTGLCKAIGDATFKSNYSVDGQFLIFRLQGGGSSMMKMKQMELQMNWDWEIVKGKDGQNHTRIMRYDRSYSIGKAIIKMDGLFGGNKVLGDTMNRFLNDNWQEIIKEVGEPSVNIVQRKIVDIINIFFLRIPFDELLPLRPT